MAGRSGRGGLGRWVKIVRVPTVPGRVTVSRDIAPTRTVHEPALPSQPGRPPAVPSQPGPPRSVVGGRPSSGSDDLVSVRRGVEALRRALDQGTVHHHRGAGVPVRRRAPGVEVVRAWAAGLGVEEQRRACRTCAAAS